MRKNEFVMIEKIISGGQTGADRAALDAAIQLGIPHGGWVPKGRIAEDGVIPSRYVLKEMPTDVYAARTEKNILDSDGTLILFHGQLSGGSALTKDLAEKHKRPCLSIDLNQIPAFKAAAMISTWITLHHVKTLNVAGPRASNDPDIYKKTRNILESVFHIGTIEAVMPGLNPSQASKIPTTVSTDRPKTVEEAVDLIISKLPLKEKVILANMTMAELAGLDNSLANYIRNNFGLWGENKSLRMSCKFVAQRNKPATDDPAIIILTALWEKLRKTHKLRIVPD